LIETILPECDLLLVMSINPGWGGQPFMPSVLPKVRQVRAMIDALGRAIELEIDGGINAETATAAVEAGADVLVAGTAIFNEREPVGAAVARLRRTLDMVAASG
jgi:ribulose-phosphate 3-epimerase